jgi:hypothetical protein
MYADKSTASTHSRYVYANLFEREKTNGHEIASTTYDILV